jgi:hypothetical protein
MGFFESCSTMPAWQAWLFAAGTSLASLTVSTVYHQVKIFYSIFKSILNIFLLVFSSSLYMWFKTACGL